MSTPARLAQVASLIGDTGRAAMLSALIDGRALTARELAGVAGVSPQTASGHLGQLLDGEILAVVKQGRHRYYRLASPAVADLLEGLERFAGGRSAGPRTGPRDPALRSLRSCYDHLAGGLAVALADRLVELGALTLTEEAGLISEEGTVFLTGLGLDPAACGGSPGPRFCRPCLDWSERRPHLAGRLGRALFHHFLEEGWLVRSREPRCLQVTRPGQSGFARVFDLKVDLSGRLMTELG